MGDSQIHKRASSSKKTSKKTTAIPVVVSNESKENLAKMVKVYPCLWDITHPDYKRPHVQVKFWKLISGKLGIGVADCKRVWKSMKDGLRYRNVNKLKKKSGDPAGDPSSDVESDLEVNESQENLESWVFYDCMKFLVEDRPKRITLSTTSEVSSEAASNQEQGQLDFPLGFAEFSANSNPNDDEMENSGNSQTLDNLTPTGPIKRKSNYDYMKNKPKTLRAEASQLLKSINELVEVRKSKHETVPSHKLKYHSIYANLDRILCQLPDEVVEDLNMEFMTSSYNALKDYNNSKTVFITTINAD